jgi:hypothetical protein
MWMFCCLSEADNVLLHKKAAKYLGLDIFCVIFVRI